jgi:hypothetical protein
LFNVGLFGLAKFGTFNVSGVVILTLLLISIVAYQVYMERAHPVTHRDWLSLPVAEAKPMYEDEWGGATSTFDNLAKSGIGKAKRRDREITIEDPQHITENPSARVSSSVMRGLTKPEAMAASKPPVVLLEKPPRPQQAGAAQSVPPDFTERLAAIERNLTDNISSLKQSLDETRAQRNSRSAKRTRRLRHAGDASSESQDGRAAEQYGALADGPGATRPRRRHSKEPAAAAADVGSAARVISGPGHRMADWHANEEAPRGRNLIDLIQVDNSGSMPMLDFFDKIDDPGWEPAGVSTGPGSASNRRQAGAGSDLSKSHSAVKSAAGKGSVAPSASKILKTTSKAEPQFPSWH